VIGPAKTDRDFLIFGDLLEHLRLQGFSLGVDHYLRIQELLKRVGNDCAPADLATLLCPVIAKNKAEQEQFHRTFQAYYNLLSAGTAESQAGLQQPPDEDFIKHRWLSLLRQRFSAISRSGERVLQSPRFIDGVIIAILMAMTGVCFSYYSRTRMEFTLASNRRDEQVKQVEALENEVDRLERDVIKLETDSKAFEELARHKFGFVRADDVVIKIAAGSPVIQVDIPTPPPNAKSAADPEAAAGPEPLPPSNSRLSKSGRLLAIYSPLFFFAIYELYLFYQRKLALQRQRGKKPPYTWPIAIDVSASKLYDTQEFYLATKLMRKRETDGPQRLDLQSTVTATVESFGYPTFCYKPDSKPSEYLLLIDRSSFQDHQARLFNSLARELEQEAIFVTRYFYDGDPRLCRNDVDVAIHLVDLQHKYPGHRVLIFGDGEQLIDPVTGKLAKWTNVFLEWRHLALLTPDFPEDWGFREITLASRFLLLPATVEGLLTLIDYFDSPQTSDFFKGRRNGSAASPRQMDSSDIVASLRAYLGEAGFQWLCACAVYPELQWDLTLYLGSQPVMPAGLVNQENLLRLVRLPWFRKGSMPDELRWLLIHELDQKKEKAIRSAIIDLLLKNPPPEESYAAETYRLDIVVHRWPPLAKRKVRKRVLQGLHQQLSQNQTLRDYTLLRFLQTSWTSPLMLLLPWRMHKIFYKRRIPRAGLRSVMGLLLTVAAMLTAAALTQPAAPLPPPPATPVDNVWDSDQQPVILVWREGAGKIVWMDRSGIELGEFTAFQPKPYYSAAFQIPPLVKGFSEGNRSQAAMQEDRERIALYKEIEHDFRLQSDTLWDQIDVIDLTSMKQVKIRLINPQVLIFLGSSEFRSRTGQALRLLQAIRKKDMNTLRRYNFRDVNRLIQKAGRIESIDVTRPDRLVIGFRSSARTKPRRVIQR
jgi:cell division protein FtsB